MNQVLLLLSCLSLSAALPGEWEFINGTNPPPGRNTPGLGYDQFSNQLIMFGGTSGTPLDDTWILNLATNTWREIPTVPRPQPRFSMVSGCSKGYFYVATGEGESKIFFNDIWQFNISSETWRQLPNNGYVYEPRYGSAGGILEGANNLYVALGFAADRYFDVFHYDVTEEAWFLDFDGDNPYGRGYPHARCLMGSTMISDYEMVFYGGCSTGGGTGGPCPAGDSWMYDFTTKKWKKFADCASPRDFSAMGFVQSGDQRRAILYGGRENTGQVIQTFGSAANQIGVLNPDASSSEWTLKTVPGANTPAKRQRHDMTSAPNGVYVFGGSTSSGSTNEVWFLEVDVSTLDSFGQSAACGGVFSNVILVHGIFMFLGWGLLLQAGAFIARYGRTFKPPMWFLLHRILQVSGLVVALIGFFIIFKSLLIGGHFRFAHAIIGLVIMILGLLQPLNTIKRPHVIDGKKSLKRRIWEIVHRLGGRSALILAMINITLGLALAEASSGVWIVWLVYFCALGGTYLFMEIGKFARKKLTDVVPESEHHSVGPQSKGSDGTETQSL